MTYVLITRPHPENHKLEELLSKDPKVPAFCEPMLHIVSQKKKLILEGGEQSKITDLMVTSCRVFEILENWQDYLDIPLWCVGDVTASKAKSMGFKTVHCANRSAQDLLEMIVKETGQKKDQYHFRHVCGDTLHLDLSEALSRLGYRADKDVVYTTQPTKELSKKFMGLWAKGSFVVAPFFSQRTTEIFVNLIKKSKLQKQCASVHALAHSEAVLKKLQELQWASIDLVPELGEESIRGAYERALQSKLAPENSGNAASRSGNKAPFPVLGWGISGILLIIVMVLVMGWFFLLPRQMNALRETLLYQQQNQTQEMINQQQELKERYKREFQDQKSAFQKEFSRLEAKISQLETVLLQANPQSMDNSESYQHKALESLSQERSQNWETLLTYQKLTTCLDHLKKSTLSKEEQDFLKTHGFNDTKAEDILSLSQLTTDLGGIDFSVYTDDTSISEKMLSFLKKVFGIQIRQKKQLSIKQTILSDLSQFRFTFLDTLNTKEILLPTSLEKDLMPWVEKATKTRVVMDKMIAEQQKILKQVTLKAKETPSVDSTLSPESGTPDISQGNN